MRRNPILAEAKEQSRKLSCQSEEIRTRSKQPQPILKGHWQDQGLENILETLQSLLAVNKYAYLIFLE